MMRSYFNETADEIKLFTNETDSYNEPILDKIAEDIPCRFIEESKLIKRGKSEEIISIAEIWLDPDISRLTQRSIITIDGNDYKVEKSGFVYGLRDKKYQKVFVT